MIYQFTPAGFIALQTALYQLPDAQLHLEALEINNNFQGWMEENFDLTATQILFLQNINPTSKAFIAYQTSFAISNRLPITLDKENQPLARGSKLIRTESSLQADSDGSGNGEALGELVIVITY